MLERQKKFLKTFANIAKESDCILPQNVELSKYLELYVVVRNKIAMYKKLSYSF